MIRESDKRVIFASSCALAHNLVRGPEAMPTLSEQALDRQFIDYLQQSDLSFIGMEHASSVCKNAGVESEGRHLAMLLGLLEGNHKSDYYGYGQSSGAAMSL